MSSVGKSILSAHVLLMVMSMETFTVNIAIDEFLIRNKIELTFTRMNQILNDLVSDGLLKKEMITNGSKNKKIAHYTFIPLNNGREQQQQSA